jgi:hypothetical protein
MPLSDEVSRDTEYHDTGQDQQRHRANDTAVQTIAREMTAHGLNPFDAFRRGNDLRHGWFHPMVRRGRAASGQIVAWDGEAHATIAITQARAREREREGGSPIP